MLIVPKLFFSLSFPIAIACCSDQYSIDPSEPSRNVCSRGVFAEFVEANLPILCKDPDNYALEGELPSNSFLPPLHLAGSQMEKGKNVLKKALDALKKSNELKRESDVSHPGDFIPDELKWSPRGQSDGYMEIGEALYTNVQSVTTKKVYDTPREIRKRKLDEMSSRQSSSSQKHVGQNHDHAVARIIEHETSCMNAQGPSQVPRAQPLPKGRGAHILANRNFRGEKVSEAPGDDLSFANFNFQGEVSGGPDDEVLEPKRPLKSEYLKKVRCLEFDLDPAPIRNGIVEIAGLLADYGIRFSLRPMFFRDVLIGTLAIMLQIYWAMEDYSRLGIIQIHFGDADSRRNGSLAELTARFMWSFGSSRRRCVATYFREEFVPVFLEHSAVCLKDYASRLNFETLEKYGVEKIEWGPNDPAADN